MKRYFYLALAMLILALPGFILFGACSVPVPKVETKAAIIDQLDVLEPNQVFIDKATTTLRNNGFKVDYYRGDDITVDFYRSLPTLGYKLILFRAHSGLQTGSVHLGSGDKTIQRTYVFTNEPYRQVTKIGEQLSDRLAKARINENSPWVFGFSADFVRQSMQGKFDRTMVIMMGCNTLFIDDMAQSFIEKGASAYTGWDTNVGLNYVDNATVTLLERLFSNKVSLEAAVKDTMQEKGADPNWGAELKYYPDPSGKKTLNELLKPTY